MCDIPFEHASVSRLHLVLQYAPHAFPHCIFATPSTPFLSPLNVVCRYRDNGDATLFDPGSTHGCRLNKKAIPKAECAALTPYPTTDSVC